MYFFLLLFRFFNQRRGLFSLSSSLLLVSFSFELGRTQALAESLRIISIYVYFFFRRTHPLVERLRESSALMPAGMLLSLVLVLVYVQFSLVLLLRRGRCICCGIYTRVCL